LKNKNNTLFYVTSEYKFCGKVRKVEGNVHNKRKVSDQKLSLKIDGEPTLNVI
jgi:hypothetical protein